MLGIRSVFQFSAQFTRRGGGAFVRDPEEEEKHVEALRDDR